MLEHPELFKVGVASAGSHDFDLFIHPTLNHQSFYRSGYVNRKLWDYFVQHLRHETPPGNVRVPDEGERRP